MEVEEISLDEIDLPKFNTRKDLDAGTEDASLEDLTASIRENGLLNPVTVIPIPNNRFGLITGQRRFLAYKKIGLRTIAAVIRSDLDDTDAMVISLVENVHRADMNPIDKARAYQGILESYGDHNRVAKEVSVSVATVKGTYSS